MSSQDFKTSTTRSGYRACTVQRGMTMIELMIALVIGVFLLIGTMTVFSQSKRDFRVADSVARLQENARFALDRMEPDIRLAKFWGRSAEPGLIAAVPGGVNVACDTADTSGAMVPATTYTAWTLNFTQDFWAVDESSGYGHATLGIPCTPNGVAQAQSDAFVVRHAGGQPVLPVAGMIQILTDLGQGEVFNNGIAPAGYSVNAQTHNVVANIYYIDQQSDLDVNTPSLRVKTLVAGGTHQDQELIAGIENLQVQLGVDTDGDGEVERYVDADHAIINPTNAGTIAGATIIAVRLWMLMRADSLENGFIDNAQYVTPDPDIQINPCAAPCAYPNNFRHLAVSKTVFLRNNR